MNSRCTDNPHDRYQQSFQEYVWLMMALFGGQADANKRLKEVTSSLGIDNGPKHKDEFPYSITVPLRVLLVYQVALFESLVKDYYKFAQEFLEERSDWDIPQLKDDSVNWMHKLEPFDASCSSFWQRILVQWTKEAEEEAESTADWNSRLKSSFVESLRDAPYWRVLYKGTILRHLVVHNNGRMNDRNHNRLPICEIGETPNLDVGLIYDFYSASNLLNTSLGESFTTTS